MMTDIRYGHFMPHHCSTITETVNQLCCNTKSITAESYG